MIRSLLLFFVVSVITSGCSREESSTKDELILGLIIGYAVNYYNPCKDGRPVLEVSQGQVRGPFNSQQCFHLVTNGPTTITMITPDNETGCLNVFMPYSVYDSGNDPSIIVSKSNDDLWVRAGCYNDSMSYSVKF